MTYEKPDPHQMVRIEINLGDPEYLNVAEFLYPGSPEQWWRELGNLLGGRPGWYCEITNTSAGTELLWSFGAVGSSLFNIGYLDGASYQLYDHDADKTLTFATPNELRDWLDANESRHTDHTLQLRDMAASSEWGVLKHVGFDVDVTFDAGMWIASVRRLPLTMAAAATLAEAVSNARHAIARSFDAPGKIAPEIDVRVRLDVAASAAL